MCHNVITYSSVDGQLVWFHFLAIVTRAALNMAEQVSLWKNVEPFEYMSSSGITGSQSISRSLRNVSTSCSCFHELESKKQEMSAGGQLAFSFLPFYAPWPMKWCYLFSEWSSLLRHFFCTCSEGYLFTDFKFSKVTMKINHYKPTPCQVNI